MKPHVRGVILEGLSNAGKTSTLKAIKQAQASYQDAERSVLVLGEHYSQQLQNIHGQLVSLSRNEHINLLNDRVTGIEQLNEWATHLGPGSRRSRGLFFVFERFHLNHRSTYGESQDITSIEHRISEAGGVCVLLTVSPENICERLLYRERTNLSQGAVDQACDEWLKDQERMIRSSRESHVSTTIIETGAQEWDVYASQILNAMEK